MAICPECQAGKLQNCCQYVLDKNDDLIPCDTELQRRGDGA